MIKEYTKDATRIGVAALGSAGAIIETKSLTERIFIFAVIALTLILSFLVDSKDPRTKARAQRILALEQRAIGLFEGQSQNISNVDPNAGKAVDTALADVKTAQDAATHLEGEGIAIADLVKSEANVAPNAVAAPNGVPPVDPNAPNVKPTN